LKVSVRLFGFKEEAPRTVIVKKSDSNYFKNDLTYLFRNLILDQWKDISRNFQEGDQEANSNKIEFLFFQQNEGKHQILPRSTEIIQLIKDQEAKELNVCILAFQDSK
jgi:hypothetical protein